MVDGGGGPLGHLIGRQSFLIGSQEIYRNEPRWRIVMTWLRAREVDLERDICECIGVYVSIHRRGPTLRVPAYNGK